MTNVTHKFLSMYLFLTLYMFRAHRAHHQERQIVSIQPLVAVTLCLWPLTSDLHTIRQSKGMDNISLTVRQSDRFQTFLKIQAYLMLMGIRKYYNEKCSLPNQHICVSVFDQFLMIITNVCSTITR